MSGIEIVGVIVSALAVWFTARRWVACWPVGLLSVALYAWIFRDARLYSDMLLQGAFAIMQIYGWRQWLRSDARAGRAADVSPNGAHAADSAKALAAAIDVRVPAARTVVLGLLCGVAGSIALGGTMAGMTDAALPWVDAALSAFSLVAQYWTARRFIASWRLWVVLDCIYVGMFVFKGLYPTALLYAGFVVLALIGWRDWSRALKRMTPGRAGSGYGSAGTDPQGLPLAPMPNGIAGAVAPHAAGVGSPGGGIGSIGGGGSGNGNGSGSALSGRPFGLSGQFGVSGLQTERDWPLMTEDELRSVLSSYRIAGEIDHIGWHSPRPFAAAVLVALTTGETLFVKRHHQRLRDVAALVEEHSFIAHLREQGVPVVHILADRLGRTAIQIGEWTYEVHGVGEGDDLYRDVMSWEPFKGVSHAYAAGAALARLHRAAQGYAAPARPPRLLLSSFQAIGEPDWLSALDGWIEVQPLLKEALATRPWREDMAAVIGPWHARLSALPAADAPLLAPLWTHGDWHASNLLWRDDAPDPVSAVLDFGLADRTCALVDLALAIERNTIEWLVVSDARPVHLDQIDALLDGYESVQPLTPGDLAVLTALLPIVHVEFALSEVGYFANVLHLPEAADVAYGDYLLGHARWFATPAGSAVLAHLAERHRG